MIKKKPVAKKKAVKKVATFDSVLALLTKCADEKIGEHDTSSRLLAYPGGEIIVENKHGEEKTCYSFTEAQEYLEDLIEENDFRSMDLVGEVARVYHDRIDIGCRTVWFDEFDALAKLVAQMRK